MLKFIHFLFLPSLILSALNSGCVEPDRITFAINPESSRIEIPIQINDSIIANLFFDTGASFNVDSTFCSRHPGLIGKTSPDTILYGGSAWDIKRIPISFYTKASKVKIGTQEIVYNLMKVYNYRSHYRTPHLDGIFNIPANDTLHVWELNFEHNYLEVYPAENFSMPEGCFTTSMIRGRKYPFLFNIKLPVRVWCENGDTLFLDRIYTVDTGTPWDIVLTHKAKELDFFNKQDNAEWAGYVGHYYRQYGVNATLFDNFPMDSLQIYTFDYPNDVPCDYIVGLNFLKRFNVYFDMQRKLVGLLPHTKFQRVIDPYRHPFFMSTCRGPRNAVIIDHIGNDYGEKYKAAGLKVGDEILSINGEPAYKIAWGDREKNESRDTITYEINRRGKKLKFVIPLNKNQE